MKDLISKFLFEKGFFLLASQLWFIVALFLGLVTLINIFDSNYGSAMASGGFSLLAMVFSSYTRSIHSKIKLNIELNKIKKNKVIDLEKDQDGTYRVQ